jgi:hypothetical protein
MVSTIALVDTITPRPEPLHATAPRQQAPLTGRLRSGQARSITDLAEQEGVTDAYVCRLLPLTCLAPDIVEAILDGRQPRWLRLAEMLGKGPSYGRISAAPGVSRGAVGGLTN